jgi:hypothetical protein
MTHERVLDWLKANFDGIDVGLLAFALSGFAASISWVDKIVRANRGEDVKEDWRTTSSTAAFIAFWVLTTGARIRQTEALRSAAVEMRGVVREAAEQAELRDERAAERDRQAVKQQERMLRSTKLLVAFAVLTLAATVVAATR